MFRVRRRTSELKRGYVRDVCGSDLTTEVG